MTVDTIDSRTEVRFEEHQTFPSWMGQALVALAIPPIVATAALLFATEGATTESIAVVAVVIVLGVAPLPVVRRSAMRTEVSEDGVRFKYWPFHRSYRRVPFVEIEAVRREESRAYGYGLKRTREGWECVPNASEGVRIHRHDGPAIFLGSDRPHELLTAIEEGRREVDRRTTA